LNAIKRAGGRAWGVHLNTNIDKGDTLF